MHYQAVALLSFVLFGTSPYAWAQPSACSGSLTQAQVLELNGRFDDRAYVMIDGYGQDARFLDAREKALANAMTHLAQCNGTRVRSIQASKDELASDTRREHAGDEAPTEQSVLVERSRWTQVAVLESGLDVPLSRFEVIECSVTSDGEYLVRLVAWAPRDRVASSCAMRMQVLAPSEAIWRSAVVPGWGQFYKGDTTRGIVFLTTEVVAVAGTIALLVLRGDALDKATMARGSANQQWNDRADVYLYSGIGAAILSAGLHVWNVVDAGTHWTSQHIR